MEYKVMVGRICIGKYSTIEEASQAVAHLPEDVNIVKVNDNK